MRKNYEQGYADALAWVRALAALLGNTAKAEDAESVERRLELAGAAAMAEEFGRQIDEHAADVLLTTTETNVDGADDEKGTVH